MKGTSRGISRLASQAILAAFFFTVAASQFAPVNRADTGKYEVTVQRNSAAKIREGATLRADIYRPKAEGNFPGLLVRRPYDNTGRINFGLVAAARGSA